MLLNDFFKISKTERTEGKIISQIELNAAHKIYSGHFPDNPITPGVVQIQMVKEVLQNVYKKELKLVSLSRCKFLKILNPTETPVITIDISFSEDPLHVSVVGSHNADTYFKLSASFADGAATN